MRPTTVDSGTLLVGLGGREAALRGWLERHGTLMAAAEAQHDAVALEGRGRVALVPSPASPDATPDERWVVRHYHRGGALASRLGDRYLRLGTPRPFRELSMLEAVRARDVPAPEPVGAAVYVAGPFYRGDLVTRWVPDSVDLATLLFDAGPDALPAGDAAPRDPAHDPGAAGMRAAGGLVRLLHDRGVVHPDLNLKNILLTPAGAPGGPGGVEGPDGATRRAVGAGRAGGEREPRALILDLDRAALRDGPVPDRARRAMVARFWRSASKWERRTGRPLAASLRQAFEDGYAAGAAGGSS